MQYFSSFQNIGWSLVLEPKHFSSLLKKTVHILWPGGIFSAVPEGFVAVAVVLPDCLFTAPGLAVASALVDISQQMPIAYKEKSGAVRNRKQQPPAQPGTCI